jgi:hypothetical protein
MVLRRFSRGGGAFDCQSCEQQWSFQPDGGSTCRVIARMYPSQMSEGSRIFDEYLDYRLSEVAFVLEAERLCGLISPEEKAEQFAEFVAKVDAKRAEIAARRRRPWVRVKEWLDS